MTDRKLLDMAIAVMENSYSPYSRLKVGAAVECMDGTVYTGCNIENTAYGTAICAETAAISAAVSDGQQAIKRIAITSDSTEYFIPCGTCLQRLREFSSDIEILCSRADGRYVKYDLLMLLPLVFDKEITYPPERREE